MASISQSEYAKAIFTPLVQAAQTPAILTSLKTAALPHERRESQFNLLKTLSPVDREPVMLPNDAFVFRFHSKEREFICLQVEGISPEAQKEVVSAAEYFEFVESDLEEAMFLFLVYSLPGIYKPKFEYLTQQSAENVLNVITEDYDGHSIFQLINLYKSLCVFEIPANSMFVKNQTFAVANIFSTATSQLRSSKIDDKFAKKVASLCSFQNVDPENVHMALTSSHWSHILLELYKSIEQAFYLPWIMRLRTNLVISVAGLELANHCRNELHWSAKEEDSIIKIFEMLPKSIVEQSQVMGLKCFSDLDSKETGVSALGKRLYKIRNQCVHKSDRNRRTPIEIDVEDWPILCNYVCDIVIYLYSNYATDLPFTYETMSRNNK